MGYSNKFLLEIAQKTNTFGFIHLVNIEMLIEHL